MIPENRDCPVWKKKTLINGSLSVKGVKDIMIIFKAWIIYNK